MKEEMLTPGTSRDYCEQLYANNLDSLEEMDKFLETYNLPGLSHEEIENLRNPIRSIPHFTELGFIALHRCCDFYKLKVCGNPALIKSISPIFLTAFAYFVSPCHVLVILVIFQISSLLFVTVICDQ